MIIYKDFMSGDELFTDIYPMKLIGPNKTIIQLQGKRVTESNEFNEASIGANPSAEEAAEGVDDSSVTGVNIVLANRLVEVAEYKSKAYKEKIKAYIGALCKKRSEEIGELENEGRKEAAEKCKEELDCFKKNFQEDLKEVILTPFKEKQFQFFIGESMDDHSMTCLMTYPEDDPEGRPVMYFIKYGLKEEKV